MPSGCVQVFYNFLIPPIVFYAGFSVKKKLFFKNLVTIAILGVLGCCATGAPPPTPPAAAMHREPCMSLYLAPPVRCSSTPDRALAAAVHQPPRTSLCLASCERRPVVCNAKRGASANCPRRPAAVVLSACLYPVLANLGLDPAAPSPFAPTPPPLLPAPVPRAPLPTPPLQPPDAVLHTRPSPRRALAAQPDAPTPPPFPQTLAAQPDAPSPPPPHAAPLTQTLFQRALRLGTVFAPTDNAAILHHLAPATQPVLHSLLFGEGVMNDITAVVILRTTADVRAGAWADAPGYVWDFAACFLLSSLTGVVAGLLSATLTKRALSTAIVHSAVCLAIFILNSATDPPTRTSASAVCVDTRATTPAPHRRACSCSPRS